MEKYKLVVIVLVYLNSEDLSIFIESAKEHLQDYKIIVVNSYHDEESKKNIEKIARGNSCDFLNVENRGYSYGNNQGIAYANTHYIYDFIIVSNPDIIIQKFDEKVLDDNLDCMIAPLIITRNGKKQNPLCARNNRFGELCKYYGYKKNRRLLVYAGIAINKLKREMFLFFFFKMNKQISQIFAAHGSFVIIPSEIIRLMRTIYDEGMFLFSEEMVLAYKMEMLEKKTLITKNIQVIHEEDGSQKLSEISYDGYESESMIYCYEKYVRHKASEKRRKKLSSD